MTPPIIPEIRGPIDCGNFDEYPADPDGPPPDGIKDLKSLLMYEVGILLKNSFVNSLFQIIVDGM